jgi:hypothetical protein
MVFPSMPAYEYTLFVPSEIDRNNVEQQQQQQQQQQLPKNHLEYEM